MACPLRACRPGLPSCINTRICAPLCLSVSHSVTDEYKMKGVEKVKYISGEEGGGDGQDSTVRDSVTLFMFYFMFIIGRLLCVVMASVVKLSICNLNMSCW